jgi:hypothetical protein
LDDRGQFGERIGDAGPDLRIGPEIVEAPAEVLNEGVSSDDHLGGAVPFQPAHRAEPCFHATVIGLEV